MNDLQNPSFPPLFRGECVPTYGNPFTKAVMEAKSNIDPGLIVYSQDMGNLEAALVLAPDIPLNKALGMVLVTKMGLADSLGALAPPEVAIQFNWPNKIKVNGAFCGEVFYQASTNYETKVPDWLVIGFRIPFLWDTTVESGHKPEETVLSDEGCIDITPRLLLESWSRHTLVWLNRFLDEGLNPVHKAWCEKCDNLGENISFPTPGVFMGLDEYGNMLIKSTKVTIVEKLSTYMEK